MVDALSPQLRDRARFLVLDSWGQSDFEGSLEAAGTLEDNELRLEIQNHLLVQHSAHDPAGAAETLKDLALSADNDSLFSSAATTIARDFLRREYQNREKEEIEGQPTNFDEKHNYAGDAIQWAFELPEGQLRTAALSGAIGAWTVADPEAASGWVDDYPVGSERDAMIEEMTILARSPEMSFLWAVEAMTPGEARNRVLVRSAIGWIDMDHEAAWRAIESNPDLSARERDLIYDSWKAFEPFRETE